MVITNIVYYFFMVKLIFKEIPFMFSLMIELTEFLLNYKKKFFLKTNTGIREQNMHFFVRIIYSI